MANKALLTWNIRSGSEREHFQLVRKFVGQLPGLGLDLADAWYTVYGDAPQILLAIVAPGEGDERLESALGSNEWREMLLELQEHITDYRQRIVRVRGQFQF
jgi:hypothetical protein